MKHKKPVIWASVIIFAAIAVSIAVLFFSDPIKKIESDYDGRDLIEYNGKVYKCLGESKYYEYIKDEKICEKNYPMFPETYYTLKNDKNNDFIYVGQFRDSRIYTSLPINGYRDVIKGNPTSIIIYKSGYKEETAKISDNQAAVKEALSLKSLQTANDNESYNDNDNYIDNYSNSDDYDIKTYGKKEHNGWYYIYVFYDDLPIASNVTGITVIDYFGEYMLLCSTTDDTYSGVVIEDSAIVDLIESIKE